MSPFRCLNLWFLTNPASVVNGMLYNPESHQWEGNDNVLRAFDVPASSPSTASVPSAALRERETSTPRPALITNFGATKGVQVTGGMIFDPGNFRWLKHNPQASTSSDQADFMEDFNAFDDEDDVFKDISDLEDHTANSSEVGQGRVSDIKDEWLVGEEFDVGPEFVRRQREEEDRWRKKCQSWFSQQERDDSWRWRIREIVNDSFRD
jgi:hypothetical protein